MKNAPIKTCIAFIHEKVIQSECLKHNRTHDTLSVGTKNISLAIVQSEGKAFRWRTNQLVSTYSWNFPCFLWCEGKNVKWVKEGKKILHRFSSFSHEKEMSSRGPRFCLMPTRQRRENMNFFINVKREKLKIPPVFVIDHRAQKSDFQVINSFNRNYFRDRFPLRRETNLKGLSRGSFTFSAMKTWIYWNITRWRNWLFISRETCDHD